MKLKYLLILGLIGIMLNACKKETIIEEEQELITTVKLTLTPTTGGAAKVFIFNDLDGSGGNAPLITAPDTIHANTNYTGSIEFLDESKSPAVAITSEIQTEGTVHQVFYQVTNANININYTDTDTNGKPIGLKTAIITGGASNGTLKITLRHEPNKSATGVSTGDISNAGGETDVEISFPVKIY